jgi:hypothetical protein
VRSLYFPAFGLLCTAVAALAALSCDGPRFDEEVTARAGLLDSLVTRATVGGRPVCRTADGRIGNPIRERTRVCAYPTIPGMQLWLPPESMAQPMLTYQTSPMPDTSYVVATRDSLLRSLQPDGQKLQLRDCPQVPPRRAVHSATRAEGLGADILFLIVQQPVGYNLHMRAWPVGARRLPCGGRDGSGGRALFLGAVGMSIARYMR